jgi:uncharacterized protein YdaU (DUF1376 family)
MAPVRNLHWYPWHIDDYAHDTRHLTLAEHGAYRLLIDCYMLQREPVPDNDRALARIVGVGLDEWLTVATNVRAFFRVRDGLLIHKRCEQELRAQELKVRKRSERAKKGAFGRYSKFKGLNSISNAYAEQMDATLTLSKITISEQGAEVVEEASEKEEKKEPKKEPWFAVSPALAASIRAKGWN